MLAIFCAVVMSSICIFILYKVRTYDQDKPAKKRRIFKEWKV